MNNRITFLIFYLISNTLWSQRPENIQVEHPRTDYHTCIGNGVTLIAPLSNSYKWSDGSTSQTISVSPGLTSDYYVDIVTQSNSQDHYDFRVYVNIPLGIYISGNSDVCAGNTTTLTASVQENADYLVKTYAWSTGESTKSINLTPSQNSTISVLVTDVNGCTSSASVNIKVHPAIFQNGISTNVGCNGEKSGAITLNMTSGTAPFVFDWFDITGNNDPKDRNGLLAGSYQVNVTDSKGCQSIGYYFIDQPTPLSLSAQVIGTNCNASTGSITIFPSGGVPRYKYDWTDIAGNDNPQNRTNLSAGTYAITLIDGNNCTYTQSFAVNAPSTSPLLMINSTGVNCTSPNSGSINVSTSGGLAPYTYYWSDQGGAIGTQNRTSIPIGQYTVRVIDANNCQYNTSVYVGEDPNAKPIVNYTISHVSCKGGNNGAINLYPINLDANTYDWTDLPGSNNPKDRTNLTSGIYAVTVKNSLGCTVSYSISVTEPNLLTASSAINQTTCGLNNGSISITPSGGTAPYTYDWTDIAGFQDLKDRSLLSPGNYALTIYDSKGCTFNASFSINNSLAPWIANDTVTNIECKGGTSGAIKLQVYGTNPNGVSKYYFYDWEDIAGNDNIRDRIGLKAGSYKLTVTDYYGCTVSKNWSITEPVAPLNFKDSIVQILCGGTNGGIYLTVSGGKVPYKFDWSDLAGSSDPKDRSNLSSGIYTVIITDSLGCMLTKTYRIAAPTAPLVNASVSPITCAGFSNGEITITLVSGKAPITYDWLDIPGTSNAKDRTALPAGSYTLKAMDSIGCSNTYNFNISTPSPLSIASNITPISTNNLLGSIDISVTGGNPAYTYDWSDLVSSSDPEDRSNLQSGVYIVKITDTKGCTLTQSISLGSYLSNITVVDTISPVTCPKDSNGRINLTISGGQAPYTFDWSDKPGYSNYEDRTGLKAGSYTITITDASAQRKSFVYSITQPPVFSFNYELKDSIPLKITSIIPVIDGGTKPYIIDWADIPGIPDSLNRKNLTPGKYVLHLIDNNGCKLDTTISLDSVRVSPLSIEGIVNQISCGGKQNGSISLNISGGHYPYKIAWFDTLALNLKNRSNLRKGFYIVTVSDAIGSAITKRFEIKEPDSLKLNYTTDFSGAIKLFPSGGVAPYHYDWKDINGHDDPKDRTGLQGGNYNITMIDSLGCTFNKEILFLEFTSLAFNYSIIPPTCPGASNGAISFKATTSIRCNNINYGIMAGKWSDGIMINQFTDNTTQTRAGLKAGIYKLNLYAVCGNNNTSAYFSIEVNDPDPIKINETHNSVSCRFPNAGYINVSVSGGTAPYIYKWSDGPTTEDRSGLHYGTYSLSVTDSKGCQVSSKPITTYSFNSNGRIIEKDTCVPKLQPYSIEPINPPYNKSCDTIGLDLGPQYCYYWSPATSFGDPTNPIQEVCPSNGEIYTLYISTPDSLIKSITYTGCNLKITLTDTVLTSCPNLTTNPPTIIPIILDVVESYANYEWFNQNDQLIKSGLSDTLQVKKSGWYTLRVTDSTNCKTKRSFQVKEECGMVCHDLTLINDPVRIDIENQLMSLRNGFGFNYSFYFTCDPNTVSLQSSGTRKTYACAGDDFNTVKGLFDTRAFPNPIGIWVNYDPNKKKLCTRFEFNNTAINELKSKLGSQFSEYMKFVTAVISQYQTNNLYNLDASAGLDKAVNGAFGIYLSYNIIHNKLIPCWLYRANCNNCPTWLPNFVVDKIHMDPMYAGIIDGGLNVGINIVEGVIAFLELSILVKQAFVDYNLEALLKVSYMTDELKQKLKDAPEYIISYLYDSLSTQAYDKYNFYSTRWYSSDRCQRWEADYQSGSDLVIIITNVLFIKDLIKGIGTATKQLNTLSKSVIRNLTYAPLNVRLVFYEDLKKASLESGFLSYINAVNGNSRAYSILVSLNASVVLRTDAGVLSALDAFITQNAITSEINLAANGLSTSQIDRFINLLISTKGIDKSFIGLMAKLSDGSKFVRIPKLSANGLEILKNWDLNYLVLLETDLRNIKLFDLIKGDLNLLKAWDKLSITSLRTSSLWLRNVSQWLGQGYEFISSSLNIIIKNRNEVVGEISDNLLKIKFNGFGGDVVTNPTKTTTVVGKYLSSNGESALKNLIESGLTKSGENIGGVNVLNDLTNTNSWSKQEIWDIINKPWVDGAIMRGDVIRATADPLIIGNVFNNVTNIPESVFSSTQLLSDFLINLPPAQVDQLSFYGREIRHLSQNNYLFNTTTKLFEK